MNPKQLSPDWVPKQSCWLLNCFTRYARWYLRRHFHSLRISRSGLPPRTELPLVLYANHASWWDPIVFLVSKDIFFPGRRAFAPMDARALTRYSFFRKLGFFGVEPGTSQGAVQFLRSAQAILKSPNHLLALTPQGRFADVRERPVQFQAGLGHLATRVSHALFVPLAAEFVFWEERLPEILLHFGEAVEAINQPGTPQRAEAWTGLLQQKLLDAQDALASITRDRHPSAFRDLLRGSAGQGGIYDGWRAVKSWMHGQPFRKEHGTL